MQTVEQILTAELGGLHMQVCLQAARIEALEEENKKLKAAAPKDPGQEKK